MVQVICTERKGNVLKAPRVPCSVTHGMDLSAGCAHGCLYCFARGYRTYPGNGRIRLHVNTLDKLRRELPRKRKQPRGVSFSVCSDLFQPVAQVLDLAYGVLDYLLRRGMPVAILTKGRIPRQHMELLCRHSRIVNVRAGLLTMDERIAATIEPHCAPPERRLSQLEELSKNGVPTGVRMDPILPGVTDDADALDRLCSAVARAGVPWVAPSVLYLRPAIAQNLKRGLAGTPFLSRLMASFQVTTRLPVHGGNSVVTVPATDVRRAIYRRVQEAAGRHGLGVRLCACKNPDITSQHCSGLAAWLARLPGPRQQGLFAACGRTADEPS